MQEAYRPIGSLAINKGGQYFGQGNIKDKLRETLELRGKSRNRLIQIVLQRWKKNAREQDSVSHLWC